MDTQRLISVLGNGESRTFIDLHKLSKISTIVGCNAIHRDMKIDHLVCVDSAMVCEAVTSSNSPNFLYVRPEFWNTYRKLKKYKNVCQLPDIPYVPLTRADYPTHWGSGTYALLIGALLANPVIYIIGFDLYSPNQLTNNIYKDSPNYAISNAYGVDPSYWIYQSTKIFQHFKSTQFIVVNLEQWSLPQAWQLPNVSKISIDQFNQIVNNHK